MPDPVAIDGLSSAADARVMLWQSGRQVHAPALGIGLQPLDALLTAIAALTVAANKGLYFTGPDSPTLFDLTAAGRALLDDADASAQLTTLGVSAFIKTLLDDADATTALATLGVSSGTWTPTGTAVSNLDSITPTVGPYLRIGDRVICGGLVTLDFTAGGGTTTDFRLSLPVASNFAAATDAAGTGTPAANAVGFFLDADTTNDALFGRTFSPGTAAVTYSWHAIYRVI